MGGFAEVVEEDNDEAPVLETCPVDSELGLGLFEALGGWETVVPIEILTAKNTSHSPRRTQ